MGSPTTAPHLGHTAGEPLPVASLELDRVHERIPLQNVITSHTYAYPQPSDLTPYGAHKEMHPMLASDPDQMLGRTDRKPCPIRALTLEGHHESLGAARTDLSFTSTADTDLSCQPWAPCSFRSVWSLSPEMAPPNIFERISTTFYS